MRVLLGSRANGSPSPRRTRAALPQGDRCLIGASALRRTPSDGLQDRTSRRRSIRRLLPRTLNDLREDVSLNNQRCRRDFECYGGKSLPYRAFMLAENWAKKRSHSAYDSGLVTTISPAMAGNRLVPSPRADARRSDDASGTGSPARSERSRTDAARDAIRPRPDIRVTMPEREGSASGRARESQSTTGSACAASFSAWCFCIASRTAAPAAPMKSGRLAAAQSLDALGAMDEPWKRGKTSRARRV